MDLAPGRSLAEYLAASGLQVFMISWRNPDARHAAWDFNTYGQAILDAMDATARITGSEQTALMGTCSGGVITAMVAAHLAHTGQQHRIAAFTLMVTVLDQARAGLASAVISERTARAGRGRVQGPRLPGRPVAGRGLRLAAAERPDLELLGQQLPARTQAAAVRHLVLERGHHPDDRGPAPGFPAAWASRTRWPRPGTVTMLGSPVDLSLVDRDTYLVAGVTDHICPWQSCYRSTQLLSGSRRFVLSTSGHIAAMVNPPGNEKARYQVAEDSPADPEQWLRRAETCRGSWWPDYAAWLAERCGEEKDAPSEPGGGGLVAALRRARNIRL